PPPGSALRPAEPRPATGPARRARRRAATPLVTTLHILTSRRPAEAGREALPTDPGPGPEGRGTTTGHTGQAQRPARGAEAYGPPASRPDAGHRPNPRVLVVQAPSLLAPSWPPTGWIQRDRLSHSEPPLDAP